VKDRGQGQQWRTVGSNRAWTGALMMALMLCGAKAKLLDHGASNWGSLQFAFPSLSVYVGVHGTEAAVAQGAAGKPSSCALLKCCRLEPQRDDIHLQALVVHSTNQMWVCTGTAQHHLWDLSTAAVM
jgi:hypothetical protein